MTSWCPAFLFCVHFNIVYLDEDILQIIVWNMRYQQESMFFKRK